MQKIFFLIIILIILLGLALILLYFRGGQNQPLNIVSLKVGGASFNIEVASTPSAKIKGLSNRDSLAEGVDGMLFIFPNPTSQFFWMKDMRFSLDMVWIRDNKVIGFEQNVSPDEGPDYALYHSNEPADMVLELFAGEVKRNNIQAGDIIEVINN